MTYDVDGDATKVLQKINLNIETNKLTMIVGPSGCGKTTLISILTGILTPTQGTVLFENKNIFEFSELQKALLRQKSIGFIFQQYNLINTLTVAENVAVPLIAAGVGYKESLIRASRMLQVLGLSGHLEQMPLKLSGGEQQRVAIARALVHNPTVVVCDEPTASLDEKNGHKIMEILKAESTSHKKAVIVVTHDNRIFKYADTIIQMNDGKITSVRGQAQ